MLQKSLQLFTILGFLLNFSQSLRFDLQSGHTKCISEDIRSNSMTVGKYHIVNPNEGFPLPDTHKVVVRVTSSFGNNYHTADHVESGQFAFTAAEAGDYMACFWTTDHNPPVTVTVDFDWKTGVAAKDWDSVAKKGSIDAGRHISESKTRFAALFDCFFLSGRAHVHGSSSHSGSSTLSLGNYLSFLKNQELDVAVFKRTNQAQNHSLIDRLRKLHGCLSRSPTRSPVLVMELELKKLMDHVTSIHEEMFYLRDREEEMQALNRTTNSRMYWLSFLSLLICLSVAGIQVWHLKSFFERKKLL